MAYLPTKRSFTRFKLTAFLATFFLFPQTSHSQDDVSIEPAGFQRSSFRLEDAALIPADRNDPHPQILVSAYGDERAALGGSSAPANGQTPSLPPDAAGPGESEISSATAPTLLRPPRPDRWRNRENILANRGWPSGLTRMELAYQALNIVDSAQTLACLSRSNCIEKNPLIGKRPSKGKFLAISGGLAIAHVLIARSLASIDTDYAKIMVGVTMATKGVVIGLNFH